MIVDRVSTVYSLIVHEMHEKHENLLVFVQHISAALTDYRKFKEAYQKGFPHDRVLFFSIRYQVSKYE